MKPNVFLTALLVTLSGLAPAHEDNHAPLHGGVVVEVKDVDYELVTRPDTVQLWVRDHGKAVDVSKASARLTMLSGTDRQEVELKPAGGRLEATGAFRIAAGTKAVVVVRMEGRPASAARFTLR